MRAAEQRRRAPTGDFCVMVGWCSADDWDADQSADPGRAARFRSRGKTRVAVRTSLTSDPLPLLLRLLLILSPLALAPSPWLLSLTTGIPGRVYAGMGAAAPKF